MDVISTFLMKFAETIAPPITNAAIRLTPVFKQYNPGRVLGNSTNKSFDICINLTDEILSNADVKLNSKQLTRAALHRHANMALTNLLVACRYMFNAHNYYKYYVNCMQCDYYKDDYILNVYLSTNFQSASSVANRWPVRKDYDGTERHDAICVRSIASGRPLLQNDMSNEYRLNYEPVGSMLTIPLHGEEEPLLQDGEITCINIHSFQPNAFPTLDDAHEHRIAKVRKRLSKINALMSEIRNCEDEV